MKTAEEILDERDQHLISDGRDIPAVIKLMEEYADQFKPKWNAITLDTLPDLGVPVLLADDNFSSFLASSLSKNGFLIDSEYEWETGFDTPEPFGSYSFWQPIIV